MSALDFHRVLSRIDHVRTNWRLYAARRIANSDDAAVHSLGSPQNQHDFDAAQHPPKPRVVFDQPVYREIRCLIKLSDSVDMDDLERRFDWQQKQNAQEEYHSAQQQLVLLVMMFGIRMVI